MKKIKTTWFDPYTKKGVQTLKDTGAGVYLIKRKSTKKVTYIGYSGDNVKKTMYRHFQSWDDSRQKRVSYHLQPGAYSCRVIWCKTANEASNLEEALIIKLKPSDNTMKIERYLEKHIRAITEEIDAEFISPAEPCPF